MGGSAWTQLARDLDFAFQPIVDASSGGCFGCEALLRRFEPFGFSDPLAVFDAAHADSALYTLDLVLRRRAVEKFVRIPHHQGMTLFYNLDNRLLDMPDYSAGNTIEILSEHGLEPSSLCFEVSERHEMTSNARLTRLLETYRQQGFQIALDDFGSGFCGLHLLSASEPDHVKIDRFFVGGVDADQRKWRFVRHLVEAVHSLGIPVVAEGVETPMEIECCRSMGCDRLQGYGVQRPQLDLGRLRAEYAAVLDPRATQRAG